MLMVDQSRVTQAFDNAEAYASQARVQKRIAARLAERIATIALPSRPRILEIGCGTGFLTAELLARGIDGEWLITDKSPAMVARCRETIGDAPDRQFATLDGEYGLGALKGEFDLICASMAMQWFDNLPKALVSLLTHLAPGGHLLFNTLTSGTFAQWHAAHRANGFAAGALTFPALADLRATLQEAAPQSLEAETFHEQFPDARSFLRGLKMIGASTARAGHTPLNPGDLRKVMQSFEKAGAEVSYEVLTCHFRKESAG